MIPDESLDPLDWDAFRASAHVALDDALEFSRTIRDRPVWRPVSSSVREALREPVPAEPLRFDEVYEQFKERILPYPTGNGHPRFWGWVMGTGTPDGIVAEMLAATMNAHVAGYDQSAALVEEQVLEWLAMLIGFPSDASGILVGGGTMANLIGLAVARHAGAGFDVREEGLQGDHPRLLVYASSATHHWVDKSCEMLGLGRRAVRRIGCDADHRIDLGALERAIESDRKEGARPICVIATAGTVGIGAIDDLAGLAALCKKQRVWLHVDGAFGALAALSPALAPLVRGIELADSIAFDLHKWGYLPYGVGCTLVRDRKAHAAAFASTATYIAPLGRGIQPESFAFADRGIELSRPFRALKVWMGLKTHGASKWGRLIEQNVAQARHLAARINLEPRLELLAPVPLNVVCFRVTRPEGRDAHEPAYDVDDYNREILLRIQESGVAVPSSTQLDGRFSLRVAITNHRSRLEDFDTFIDALLAIVAEVDHEWIAT